MNRRSFLQSLAAAGAGMLPFGVMAFDRPLPYALMHVLGRNPCWKIGLLMPENPPQGSAMLRSQFRHIDGSPIETHSESPLCDSCGRYLPIGRPAIKFIGAAA